MTRTTNVSLHQKLVAAVLFISLMMTGSIQADVIFYQGFDYGTTEGNLSTIGSADWSTSSAVDALYQKTSLKQKDSLKTGGSVKTPSTWGNGQQKIITQALDISLAGKTEFWVSCLISIDSATPAKDSSASISLVIVENHWQGNHPYTIGKSYGNTNGYVFSASGTGGDITNATFALVETNTTRVVYHVKTSTVPEVWVNPLSQPSVGTGQTMGATTQGSLTSIKKLEISFLGLVANLDEFIVGDTFADVSMPKKTVLIIR